MSSSASCPFCIATIVTDKAIESLLENQGQGNYRDTHPWLVAARLLERAGESAQSLPILFASKPDAGPAIFSHWSTISRIDVVELHRGQWDSRVAFQRLQAFNPIWSDVDSVFVMPSAEQLQREQEEGIRVVRQALDEYHIHPYALCETPAFILEALTDAEH
ncbi:MAG: hypothetical protein AAF513_15955 [Pseudomonadota bacterium]